MPKFQVWSFEAFLCKLITFSSASIRVPLNLIFITKIPTASIESKLFDQSSELQVGELKNVRRIGFSYHKLLENRKTTHVYDYTRWHSPSFDGLIHTRKRRMLSEVSMYYTYLYAVHSPAKATVLCIRANVIFMNINKGNTGKFASNSRLVYTKRINRQTFCRSWCSAFIHFLMKN